MPGILHQGILSLFCDDPWLPFDLLGLERPISGTLVDRRADVESLPSDARTVPVGLPDLVLCGREIGDRSRGVVICIEAQRQPDAAKRYNIPFYQAALAKRHQLPTWSFVVSFSPVLSSDVRGWSKGPPPRVEAHLLDVDTVPVPASLEEALARPTAAVLAAALHGCRGNLDAARLGIRACRELPKETRLRYTRTILAALTKARRELLEQELPVEQRDELWEIERLSSPYIVGVEEGLERGLEQGLERGLEQGRREILVDLVFTILELRGVPVDAASDARIRACTQPATLKRWAERARAISDIGALFES